MVTSSLSRRALIAAAGALSPLAYVNGSLLAAEIPGVSVGAEFPDVVYRTEQGTTSTVAASRGQVRMLYLWAVWCPICYNDIVNIQRIYDSYKGNGSFKPIVMNIMNDFRAGVAWARGRGVTLPLDDSGMEARNSTTAATTAGSFQFPRYTPQFYLLDRSGRVTVAAGNAPTGTIENYQAIGKLLTG